MEVTSGNLTRPEFESLISSSRSCPLHKELRIVRIQFCLVHTKAYLFGLDKICKFLKSQLPHLYIEGIVLLYLPNPFQFCTHYESQESVVVKKQVLEINSWIQILTLPFVGSVSLGKLLNLVKSHFTRHYGLINSTYFRASSL